MMLVAAPDTHPGLRQFPAERGEYPARARGVLGVFPRRLEVRALLGVDPSVAGRAAGGRMRREAHGVAPPRSAFRPGASLGVLEVPPRRS